jgi:GT2 family glycosyltransferase
VIKDGSTWSNAFEDELVNHWEDENLVFLRTGAQQGAAGARMMGIEAGDGGILAFLDQDDTWHSKKLDRQVTVLERRPGVSLVHTDVAYIDAFSELVGTAERENRFRRRVQFEGWSHREIARSLVFRNNVRLCSVAVRRAAFENLGGFDSSLFGGEDKEFIVRYAAEGYRMVHLNEPLLHRRVHKDNTSARYAAARAVGRWNAHEKLARRYPFLQPHLRKIRRRMVWRHARNLERARLEGAANLARLWVQAEPRCGEARFYEAAARLLRDLRGGLRESRE